VPRYFFHMRNDKKDIIDSTGAELPDIAAVKDSVKEAREQVGRRVRNIITKGKYWIDVEDETGSIVYRFYFHAN